jgi:nitrate reductase beta subunit
LRWEDNQRWKGGWELDRRGRLRLRGGGYLRKLLTILQNPHLPSIDDYYEPWSYDYENLMGPGRPPALGWLAARLSNP